MRLIYRVLMGLSVVLMVVLAVWAFLFYLAVADEINDELDDSLEEYAEMIITRSLSGEELPVADNGMGNRYRLSELDPRFAEEWGMGEEYYFTEDEERVLSMVFRDRDDRYFELVVSTPTVEGDDLREAVWHWSVFLYFFLLLSVVVVTAWVFYRNMKPLYVLLDWLDAYRIGRPNEPLRNETRVAEFRKLNEAALRNAERSERMYERQKRFIGNASHEIQTPLAICRNRIENLMEDDSLGESQLEELYKTHKTLEYITKLNKTLLLLTKIDNGQFIDVTEVDLNDLLGRYLEDFKEVYAYRRIGVETRVEGTTRVTMNESLAASLFSNLLKNAFAHNVDQGRISIWLGHGRFEIRNTGEEGALDKERVFEHFYQGRKKEGSTGLGLAIARAICVERGFDLSYEYAGDMHVFRINFRKA